MHSIADLKNIVNKHLSEIEVASHPADLYDPIRYMLNLEKPALGVEVFHNFTLLHDDIMDNAPLRRSNATVHEKWNTNVAILSGDAMFVQACQLVMEAPENCLKPVMNLFLDTSIKVCEGQQLDMDFEQMSSVDIDKYIEMIGLKTAELLAGALKMGALISKAGIREADHLYEFGKNIGIAFQLKDDILDVFGDQSLFGKQPGGDIVSNKKTFLLLKAMELSGNEEQKILSHWINLPSPDIDEKIKAVKDVFITLGIKEYAEQEMERYYNIALDHLNEINIDERKKVYLKEFAGFLMVRNT